MKIIVFTPGTRDIFYVGHLKLIKSAKALGDILVFGIKIDELVKDKGHHPLMSYADRAAVLGACIYVDLVVPENKIDRDYLLAKDDVDILAVGDDWWGGHEDLVINNLRVYLSLYSGTKFNHTQNAPSVFMKNKRIIRSCNIIVLRNV